MEAIAGGYRVTTERERLEYRLRWALMRAKLLAACPGKNALARMMRTNRGVAR